MQVYDFRKGLALTLLDSRTVVAQVEQVRALCTFSKKLPHRPENKNPQNKPHFEA